MRLCPYCCRGIIPSRDGGRTCGNCHGTGMTTDEIYHEYVQEEYRQAIKTHMDVIRREYFCPWCDSRLEHGRCTRCTYREVDQ